MFSAFLKIQQINPKLARVSIIDERVPAALAEPTLGGDIPPPVHKPKVLFEFTCDPLALSAHGLGMGYGPDDRTKVEIDGE